MLIWEKISQKYFVCVENNMYLRYIKLNEYFFQMCERDKSI